MKDIADGGTGDNYTTPAGTADVADALEGQSLLVLGIEDFVIGKDSSLFSVISLTAIDTDGAVTMSTGTGTAGGTIQWRDTANRILGDSHGVLDEVSP